jgi:hypothetical protein
MAQALTYFAATAACVIMDHRQRVTNGISGVD